MNGKYHRQSYVCTIVNFSIGLHHTTATTTITCHRSQNFYLQHNMFCRCFVSLAHCFRVQREWKQKIAATKHTILTQMPCNVTVTEYYGPPPLCRSIVIERRRCSRHSLAASAFLRISTRVCVCCAAKRNQLIHRRNDMFDSIPFDKQWNSQTTMDKSEQSGVTHSRKRERRKCVYQTTSFWLDIELLSAACLWCVCEWK